MRARRDAAKAFVAWTPDCGSSVGHLERGRRHPLVRFGGTEEGRRAGTRTEAACGEGGEDDNQDMNASLERKCWQAV